MDWSKFGITKPYYSDDAVCIVHADCRQVLPLIPAGSIDLVLTDPPYESMRRWEGIGTTARMGMGRKGSGADDESKFFKTIPNENLMALTYQFSESLKESRHAYVMCDEVTLPSFYILMRLGFNCCDKYGNPCQRDYAPPFDHLKTLVWDKLSMGMGYHYRCCYELILMFDKGKNRRLNDLSIPDVIQCKRIEGADQEVPTQKPTGLFKVLISQSTQQGEVILDPFLGSGTTAYCAKKLGRKCIGIEIEERYAEIAARRCSQTVMELGA